MKKNYCFVMLSILIVGLFSGCTVGEEKIRAWYPIKKINMKCPSGDYLVYQMLHTTGWSSNPFLVNTKTLYEIQTMEDCSFVILERYHRWDGSKTKDSRTKLQKSFTLVSKDMDRDLSSFRASHVYYQ